MNNKFPLKVICGILSTVMIAGTLLPVQAEETVKTRAVADTVATGTNTYSSYRASLSDYPSATGNIYTQVQDDKNYTKNVTPDNETTVNLNVAESAVYAVKVKYAVDEEITDSIPISIKVDGNALYDELDEILLPIFFKDGKEDRADNLGNELSKEMIQQYGVCEYVLKNQSNTYQLLLQLNAGSHSFSISTEEQFALLGIELIVPEKFENYGDYSKKHASENKYEDFKCLEAEITYEKNSAQLIQLSDNTSADVSPYDYSTDRINYIGGSNWSQPGDTITWEIDVPESGLYKLGFNYRQNHTLNTTFYRELRIDGQVPFDEAKSIEFPYALNWSYICIGEDEENPYWFYLEKGKRKISLSVTLGKVANASAELETVIYGIGEVYRKMVMITGDVPDANRDYHLFERVPNLEEDLNKYNTDLKAIAKDLSKVFGSTSVSSIATVNSMINVVSLLLDNKQTAHQYINRYYDNYASLSSMHKELTKMPLDIDRIYYGDNFENPAAGWWKSTVFSVQKFFHSFVSPYKNSSNTVDSDREITIWINWGRDQAKVLKYLIQSDFSTKHNINVEIKLTNASLTHAALSGSGPDLQLHLSRSEPVNLAMRDAVYDLTNFDDFDEVAKRFKPTAMDCYKFEDGVYALPDQQTFFMMFIREDIFEELGLEIPKTWDEFINVSVLLLRRNMQVGLPYTQIAEMTQVNAGVGALSIFPTILYQNGGKMYNSKQTDTNLLSDVGIKSFTTWTDFYTKYGYPKTYDFFNRFRLGLMPMAVQNYTLYANLTAAAPEITDYWEMYEVPGIADENGNVNHLTTGGGTGAVILSESENKDEAWEFLKWWISDDIQYRYGTEVENILGASARYPSANVNAVAKYNYRSSTLKSIMNQWDKVIEVEEVPGGYNVSRVLDQAFWNVTNASENPKDMLTKWNKIAKTEIERKREQYNIG